MAALAVLAGSAIGAASRPHSVDVTVSTPDPAGLTVVALLLAAAVAGLTIGSTFMAPTRGPNLERTRRGARRVPMIVKVVGPLMLIMLALLLRMLAGQHGAGTSPANGPVPVVPGPAGSNATSGGDPGLLLAAVAVGLVATVVAAVLFRRPTQPVLAPEPRTEAAAILDEGLDALLGERDPRRAVIAAYVAMERAMARRGWDRRPAEAPTEYLARILHVASGRSADLDRLVGLYEIARFSEHPVTAEMRDVARESVLRLRTDLESPQ